MTISKSFQKTGLALAAVLLLALAIAPLAYAADLEDFGGDWVDTGYYDTWSPSYDSYNDYGWVDTGYYDTWSPSYDTSSDCYSSGCYSSQSYSSPSYSSPSYSSPSYSSPSYSSSVLPSSQNFPVSSILPSQPFIPPSIFIPPQVPSNTNTNVNTNTNTCVGGSCNNYVTPPTVIIPPASNYDDHSVWQYVDNTCSTPGSCSTTYDDHSIFYAPTDDHSVFNAPTTVTITNSTPAPQPTIIYQQPAPPTPPTQTQTQTQIVYNNPAPQPTIAYQPMYQPSYNQPAPPPMPRPVAPQPYVTLSQIPYTGLDLGPIGTALYWSFLVLWTLFVAYLIVYKRVQTKLVGGLNKFFFAEPSRSRENGLAERSEENRGPFRENGSAKLESQPFANGSMQGIDPFVASQINRA